jgi:ankyrin repeat protein
VEIACSRSSSSPSSSSNLSLIKELLLSGSNIGAVNGLNQFTGLMYAAANGAVDVVSLLLSIKDIPKSEQEVLDLVRRLGGIGGSSSRRVVSAGLVNYSSNFSSAGSYPDMTVDDLLLFSTANTVGGASFPAVSSSLKKSSTFYPCPLSLAAFSSLPSHRSSLTGKSALHLAAEEGHSQMVLLLLKIGMSLSDADKENNNVYHLYLNRLLERREDDEDPGIHLKSDQGKREGKESDSDGEENVSQSSSLLIGNSNQAKNQKKDLKGKKTTLSAKDKGFLAQLLSVEKMKWQHYRKSIQPKGYENMNSPKKPLFTRNHYGCFPLDLAMKLERDDDDKSLSSLLVEGMIDIYCTLQSSSVVVDPLMQVSDMGSSRKLTDSNASKKSSAKSPLPMSVPPFSSSSFSSSDISTDMMEWLIFLKGQLTKQQPLAASEGMLADKDTDHRTLSSTVAKVSRSSASSVPTVAEALVTRDVPLSVKGSSFDFPGKIDFLRGVFTPFLLYRRKMSDISRAFHQESKEETMNKEEKDEKSDGIFEEREREDQTNEDEVDTLEYMFALTPLALKTFHPIVNK